MRGHCQSKPVRRHPTEECRLGVDTRTAGLSGLQSLTDSAANDRNELRSLDSSAAFESKCRFWAFTAICRPTVERAGKPCRCGFEHLAIRIGPVFWGMSVQEIAHEIEKTVV